MTQLQGMKVLVVEISEWLLPKLVELLEARGADVSIADEKNVLDVLAERRPNVLLVQSRVPQAAFLERIRAQLSNAAVIAMSEEDEAETARKAGFDDFVRVPFSFARLLECLEDNRRED